MFNQIFLNLPVADLKKSMAFFTALGFTFNHQFTDDTAACMIIGENIFAMLLTHEKMRQFTDREIIDARKQMEVINSLPAASVAAMNELADKAIANGATEPKPATDMGFMQLRTFLDPDGHQWEIFYMDMSKMPQQA